MARRKKPAGRPTGGHNRPIMSVHREIRRSELRARQRRMAERWAVMLGLDLADKKWQDVATAAERKRS